MSFLQTACRPYPARKELLFSSIILAAAVLVGALAGPPWLSASIHSIGLLGAVLPLIARYPNDIGPLMASAGLMSIAEFAMAALAQIDPSTWRDGHSSAGVYIVVLLAWRPGQSAGRVLGTTAVVVTARILAYWIAELT